MVAETAAAATQGIVAAARSVLLVDDEADVRATIAATLRELDYRVMEAADGSGALDCLISGAVIDLLNLRHRHAGAVSAASTSRARPGACAPESRCC